MALYRKICAVVLASNTQTAEMAKILENTYRAVNIALANEMKILADAMGLDIFEVIHLAATKPFGFAAFYPGPGMGGHCIPIDPFYLTWKAKEYGLNTKFIELTGELNVAMPNYVVSKVVAALNEHQKSVKGSQILLIGLAYKKNVGDLRESPGVVLFEKLQKMGGIISYHDPYVPIIPSLRGYDLRSVSVDLDIDTLAGQDCVLVVTDHDCLPWVFVRKHSSIIVDTRGVYPVEKGKIYRA